MSPVRTRFESTGFARGASLAVMALLAGSAACTVAEPDDAIPGDDPSDDPIAEFSDSVARTGCGVLASGATLRAGQSLFSCRGWYELRMQGDGNFVLYAPGGVPKWSSRTNGKAGVRATMQGDGNLVVYDAGNHPLWASGTHGHPGATLAMQDDGNAVIYQGPPLWATRTNRPTLACSASSSAALEMRAFIPDSLCGHADAPGNASCPGGTSNPPGFGEPASLTNDRFHGDFRGFSNTYLMSHRLAEFFEVPDLHTGCRAPSTPAFATCDASHKCARGLFDAGYTAQTKTAAPQTTIRNAQCTGPSSYYVDFGAKASYPFTALPVDNAIYNEMIVNSLLNTQTTSPSFGTQWYYVDFFHTPFPFHEVIANCGGANNVALYRYSASDCGPSLDNLGAGQAFKKFGAVQFGIKDGLLTVF